MGLPEEAAVVINGVQLTRAQTMTLRVAVSTFLMTLDAGLGDDEHGKALTLGYRERAREVEAMLVARPSHK